jgi:hypothetical protein
MGEDIIPITCKITSYTSIDSQALTDLYPTYCFSPKKTGHRKPGACPVWECNKQ